MSDAEQARTFAGALLGDHGGMLDGLRLTLSTFSSEALGPQTHWLPATADSLASAITTHAAASTTVGVYVGVGLTRGARAIDPQTGKAYKRLAMADVDGLAWLWSDIDIAGVAHGSRMPLVPDLETAVAVARCTGLMPTALVNTGHGVQAHWRLAEPLIYGCVDFDDDGVPIIDPSRIAADRAAGEELAWSFVKSLQIRAKRLGGWHVDPTTDTNRLVRCPGSYNRKVAGDHRPVVLLDVDASRRYDLDDIRAVLAPEKLLGPLRGGDAGNGGQTIAGVDLPGLWAGVRLLAPAYVPDWLGAILDSGWAPELAAIWSGAADAQYDNDHSSIDAALVTALLRENIGLDCVAEALMCRRLRIDHRVEKVDPARRGAYYIGRTIGRVLASMRARESTTEGHLAAIQAVTAEVAAQGDDDNPAPSQPQTDPNLGASPDAVEASASEVVDDGLAYNENAVTLEGEPPAPTQVGAPGPDSNESDVSVGSGPDNEGDAPEPPLLRAVPPVEPDLLAEHADAPVAPRQGIDDSLPRGPRNSTEELQCAQLSTALGLPPGVTVWTVGERKLTGNNEVRVWLRRSVDSVVKGGTWRPGSVGATRWHAKGDWDARARVSGILQHDLNLFVDVMREWRSDEQGLKLMYELCRDMPAGTPAEAMRLAVVGLLRHSTGTGLFATACTTRDPWVTDDDGVWIPLVNIRGAMQRLGHTPPDAAHMGDTLGELRCKVRAGMGIEEGNRVVHDAEQWVRVPEDLVDAELWAQVGMRAAQRDSDDKRNDIRVIGGE